MSRFRTYETRLPRPRGRQDTRQESVRQEPGNNGIRSEMRAIHSEARADREAFEKHITRPTQERSRLTGIVERMRASR